MLIILFTGSGQKYGNTFRVRVQLIAVRKERHLWVESYDKEIKETKDIFRVQSQIAQSIAEELKAIITPEEKQLIEKTSTTNLTAYDFYLKGRDEHLNFWLDKSKMGALNKAQYFYKRALHNDSTLAKAYSGLALAYIDKNIFSKDAYLSKNYLDSALLMADLALRYDHQLAEAYSAKASYYLYTGRTDQASNEANKALEYNPNYWEIYGFTGMMFLNDPYHLDFVKGIESLKKAIGINRGKELPLLLRELGNAYSSFAGFIEKANSCNIEALNLDGDSTKYINFLISKEWLLGNFKGAIEYCLKYLAVDSSNMDTYNTLGESYAFLGMTKESYKYYKIYVMKLEASGNLSINRFHRIGYVYSENGFKKDAVHFLEIQKKLCEESIKMNRAYAKIKGVYYDLAGIYAFTGNKAKVYQNLREWSKITVCPLWWIIYIKNDPLFNSIRNEPEFQSIVRNVESKYQAEHERVGKWLEEQGML
jgi:tetratricopeptide (TPR) repeat protein